MIVTLLFISFILHGVCFYWIYQLKKQKDENTGIEDAIAVFLEDMKEENEALIQTMKNHQSQIDLTATETNSSEKKDEEKQPVLKKKDYVPPEAESPIQDQYESSFEAQALSLANKGYHHEEIAKKLGRGKGEVELLLRMEQAKKMK